MFNEIKDFAAPELDVYARTSEVQLYDTMNRNREFSLRKVRK